MTVDHVYAVLAKVHLSGGLHLDCPSGGSVAISAASDSEMLRVNCSDESALWDLFRLSRQFGPGVSIRNFRYLKSPLPQIVEVYIDGDKLLSWQPDGLPKVASVSGVMRWLRSR